MTMTGHTLILAAALLMALTTPVAAQTTGGPPPSAPPPPPPASPAPHQHQHPQAPPPQTAPPLPPFIPPITDEDRQAAFPDVHEHGMLDDAINYFVRVDELEWQAGNGERGLRWDASGWIGRDIDRFWFRTEGEGEDGRVGHAEAHLLYGRAFARWWEVVAGIRHDVRPGPQQTWAAIGLQGLAPYWFEVEATAYLGAGGRTQFRLETEYDLLFTNRLILQPTAELDVFGKSDPARGVGAGLSTIGAGLRVRYELRRELAPYVGVSWERKFLGTADAARAAGERTSGARLVIGVRVWH